MPELIDVGARGVSRRLLLRGAGALLPGLMVTMVGGGAAAAAGPSPAGGRVRGAFSASGYAWPAAPAAAAAPGVVFRLAVDGRPLPGRRVRFSISEFHAVAGSVWFEAASGGKRVSRLGYLDLDTDASGAVVLDGWLRRGAVPTAALGAYPVLRAQLVGAETILASTRLSVG